MKPKKKSVPRGWSPMSKKEARKLFARHKSLRAVLRHLDDGIINRGFIPMPSEVAMVFINAVRSVYSKEE